MRIQRIGPQAHDMEIGYVYDAGAIVPDGTPSPERDPMASVYRPNTRPGSRLPHAWLERAGRRASTHDLIGIGRFVLFVGAGEAAAWERAAQTVARQRGFEIEVVSIGGPNGWRDVDGTWAAMRGVDEDGAVLARPDGHVGWRSPHAPENHVGAIASALEAMLGGASG